MSDRTLLHLTTPAEWRAALETGAVTPPSLAEVGFVHLSTPDQVHLPAERLLAGRRDVVLLVVDPARLHDPVQLEPGAPGDPASMRFPHLYGPLPTSAVVAVVPWRAGAPLELPAPDDPRARALAMALSVPARRAAQVRDVPGGLAVLDPAFPHSRDDNRLLLTGAADANGVEALTAEVAADAGWPARTATLLHPDAGPVADELARRGWDISPTLVLAHRGPFPVTADGPAEVVPQAAVHRLWARSWRRELAASGSVLDDVVAQLVGREHRKDRVVQVTDLAVRADLGDGPEVVAALQLRVDGATASVESVLTDPRARRRGHADALLTTALQRAGAAGCDLVVLEAAELDWPRHWYARRGFAAVGKTFDVVHTQ
ncbi:MAG TPA: GNAT family N-acetyltransferase [Modestobacter sp.]|nr:GNAT family N-acetyltransferase [Modestobacter sp.]